MRVAWCFRWSLWELHCVSGGHFESCMLFQMVTVIVAWCFRWSQWELHGVSGGHNESGMVFQVVTVIVALCFRWSQWELHCVSGDCSSCSEDSCHSRSDCHAHWLPAHPLYPPTVEESCLLSSQSAHQGNWQSFSFLCCAYTVCSFVSVCYAHHTHFVIHLELFPWHAGNSNTTDFLWSSLLVPDMSQTWQLYTNWRVSVVRKNHPSFFPPLFQRGKKMIILWRASFNC